MGNVKIGPFAQVQWTGGNKAPIVHRLGRVKHSRFKKTYLEMEIQWAPRGARTDGIKSSTRLDGASATNTTGGKGSRDRREISGRADSLAGPGCLVAARVSAVCGGEGEFDEAAVDDPRMSNGVALSLGDVNTRADGALGTVCRDGGHRWGRRR